MQCATATCNMPEWCDSHWLGQGSRAELDQRRRRIEETQASCSPDICRHVPLDVYLLKTARHICWRNDALKNLQLPVMQRDVM